MIVKFTQCPKKIRQVNLNGLNPNIHKSLYDFFFCTDLSLSKTQNVSLFYVYFEMMTVFTQQTQVEQRFLKMSSRENKKIFKYF